jgi:hypothetical protein
LENTADIAGILRIISRCYDQWVSNKLENLNEILKFLEIYKLLSVTHNKKENLNRLRASKM